MKNEGGRRGGTNDGGDETGAHDLGQTGLEDPVDRLRRWSVFALRQHELAHEHEKATHRPMYCLISARSMKAPSVHFRQSTRKEGKEEERTDRSGEVRGSHDETVLAMLELVELSEERVDDLRSRTVSAAPSDYRRGERTRRASEGSLPSIAPARAAVRDSTSSAQRISDVLREQASARRKTHRSARPRTRSRRPPCPSRPQRGAERACPIRRTTWRRASAS